MKINAVLNRELPEVNDEFAKTISPKFETMYALREAIAKEIKANTDRRSEEGLVGRLRTLTIEANEFPIPPQLIDLATHRMKERFKENGEISEEIVEKYLRPIAGEEAKWELLAEQIAKQLDKLPSEEEIEREIQVYARMNKIPVAELKERFEDPVRRRSIRIELCQQTVLQAIREKAAVEEKPIAFSEFGKLKEV